MILILKRKTAQGLVKDWVYNALLLQSAQQLFENVHQERSRVDQAILFAERAKFISQLSTHVTKVTLSSAKQDWLTPPWFLDIVRRFGPIALDPCANPKSFVNAWCSFYGPPNHICGLSNSWWVPQDCACFVNPPYGRKLALWAAKMASEYGRWSRTRGSLIALIPARTGTGYWERYVWPFADAVCFWNGGSEYPSRMCFYDLTGRPATAGATFDAAVVYFGNNGNRFSSIFAPYGSIQFCN